MPALLKYTLRYTPLLLLALILIPLRVYTAGWGGGQSVSNHVQLPFGAGRVLYSVTMLSSNDVWAVGGSFAIQPGVQDRTRSFAVPSGGIIMHYTDNAWVVATVKTPLPLPLLSVSLDSPRDGWAVGYQGTLVHYDGHTDTWSTVPGPVSKNLLGVVMLSPSDGWAVGYSGTILHYDGKQWTQVASPTSVDLRSIAMPSAQEGWAVGDNGTILHYSNGIWSIASSPTNTRLNNVSMLSTIEGWAVGQQGTILHYRAGTWERVYPANYYWDPYSYQSIALFGVAMNSIRSGWIIANEQSLGDQRFLLYSSEAWIEPGNAKNALVSIRYTESVKYAQLKQNPLSLYGITMSPSGEGWAVGSTTGGNGENAIVILHYQDNTWDVSL